ncbi:MAG TPA: LamG-like jellyroll fold domain-containing protein, partial [Methylomirabilota bacterium]|nr:LamG-like jellyroll fold domain-containing protein [Methylomirabilota bacterium]
MKALLINGARPGGPVQSPAGYLVKSTRNPYGWGVPNLTNSLPSTLADSTGPLLMWDSGPSNALATGQSFTRVINVANAARSAGLRFTLVWTDPPGNPAVGIKLVNDLDLIVTNLTTGEVHVGNDIAPNSLYNRVASSVTVTNTLPTDRVNNVENVFLRPGLATSYSVTVRARRVNVNAVSQHTNNVVQDFALVVASERTALADALSIGGEGAGWDPNPPLVIVTNGIPILNQRVAANPPLIGGTNGVTNQWNFYVVTNTPPDGSSGARNIAFTTFFPPQLSRLRNSQDGDLDMFVSENPAITNLDAAALATAFRSTGRGGTESVVLTNATPEALYYVAIKSEDQQAVNFGFFAISSLSPFSQENDNGEIIAQGFPAIVEIPDGSPEFQQAAIMFAFVVQSRRVQNAVAEVEIVHENGGDLVAKLSHNQRFAVLYNHRQFEGDDYTLFDDGDSGENEDSTLPVWRVSSGPETLKAFIGEEAVGVWQLNVFDLAPSLVGRIQSLVLRITPEPEDLLGDDGFFVKIKSRRWFYFAVDVPADATNLVVCAAPDAGPVEVYLRREEVPTRDLYDVFATIAPPGDCLNLSVTDSPPLSRGRYYVGVFNPNATAVTVNLKVRVERDLALRSAFNYRATNSVALIDDAVTNSTIFVNRRGTIADVSVGVRIDHDRVSDLVLHLISPSGTRLLLAENRGGALATNYGAGVLQTNVSAQDASGGFQANTNSIGPVQPVGVVEVEYEFYGVPDQLRIYYENELIFDTGLISGSGKVSVDFGPGSATNVVIVMNEGDNPNLGTAWNYTAVVLSGMSFTRFSDSAAVPIKFAVPPFGTTNIFQPTTTNLSNFEMPPAGDYQAPPLQVIDGWDLVTNRVTVVRNAALAHTGNQFLALANGQMRRVLTTTAGRDYRLSFAHRTPCLVSWWPGEGSPEDIVGDNEGVQAGGAYSPGRVGRAFDFTGPADGVSIPPSTTLNVGTNEGLAIEMWVRPEDLSTPMPLFAWTDGIRHGVSLWLSHPTFGAAGSISAHFDAPTGPIGYLVASAFAQAGVYQHIALTYDADTGRADLYLNGVPAGSGTFSGGRPLTTGPAHIGFSPRLPAPLEMPGTYFFRGQLDEISLYHCALTEPQIAAIHAAGALGKCGASGCLPGFGLSVDDNTYEFSSEGGWQRNSARFTAVTNGSVVTLTGGAFSSLLDDFELTELPFE